jgi:hypothetical protein
LGFGSEIGDSFGVGVPERAASSALCWMHTFRAEALVVSTRTWTEGASLAHVRRFLVPWMFTRSKLFWCDDWIGFYRRGSVEDSIGFDFG